MVENDTLPPDFVLKSSEFSKTGIIIDAPVAKDFSDMGKELIPIVFSHGLAVS